MKKKNALRLGVIVWRWIERYLDHIRDLMNLASLEARLAVRSVWRLVLLTMIFAILIITTWTGLLIGLFVFLLSQHLSWFSSFIVIITLNIFLLALVGFFMRQTKKDMTFPSTRRQWDRGMGKRNRRKSRPDDE